MLPFMMLEMTKAALEVPVGPVNFWTKCRCMGKSRGRIDD